MLVLGIYTDVSRHKSKNKKGQNVSISGNHGNQSYLLLAKIGKCHISDPNIS